jgi:hypothetical protein
LQAGVRDQPRGNLTLRGDDVFVGRWHLRRAAAYQLRGSQARKNDELERANVRWAGHGAGAKENHALAAIAAAKRPGTHAWSNRRCTARS